MSEFSLFSVQIYRIFLKYTILSLLYFLFLGWWLSISSRRYWVSRWVYISVVTRFSWPSIICITRKFAPPSSRWVAKEWRRVWGLIFFFIPAFLANSFIIISIIVRVNLEPYRFRNKKSSLPGFIFSLLRS